MKNQSLFARQLEYFECLYREKNYSAAARKIPITYQGLRKAMAKLEGELEVPLFIANDEDQTLDSTPFADALYDEVIKWSQDIKNLEGNFEQMRSGTVTVISLCAAMGALAFLGYDLVSEFEDRFPQYSLRVYEYADDYVDHALVSEEFGIGLTAGPFNEELSTKPLGSQMSAAWVNRDNPLSEKPVLHMRDLDGQTIVLPEPHYKQHVYFAERFREEGIVPKRTFECSDMLWSYSYAIQNRGIGICVAGSMAIPVPKDYGEVVQLPIVDGFTCEFGISMRRGHVLTEGERGIVDFFVSRCGGPELEVPPKQ